MRLAGEELIAHGKADAGHAILARAVTWYQTLPSREMERLRHSLALTLLSAGRLDESIALLELLDQETPDQVFILGALGVAKALQGDRKEAERISAQLEGMDLPYSFGSISAWQAQIAASLGNMDQTFNIVTKINKSTEIRDLCHFSLNSLFDAEFLFDFTDNTMCKIKNFFASGIAMVYQYQGLIFMNTGITKTFSLKTTLLDKPTCRNFISIF